MKSFRNGAFQYENILLLELSTGLRIVFFFFFFFLTVAQTLRWMPYKQTGPLTEHSLNTE